ncbi:dual specificity kinase TTK [Pelobates cultripes]|uniref:Dual specificity protein kinase TTK n=1 Tax=Pelobates cultripes TaxID=61616 RepID=A0AAD1RDH7_PELCU|nr:dual specificity kinase TTK [Pelobates cultripes]
MAAETPAERYLIKMDDEDISERKLKIASILDRVKSFKTKYGTEDNLTDELTFSKSSADTTEHTGIFNHLLTLKAPEEWLRFLVKMENSGLPQTDRMLLNKLIENYSRAVGALPAEKHSHNESYAQILVRFAELKALIDPEEAREQFQLARLNCKKFAFVHTGFAQFELAEGNSKKSKQILQRGMDCGAIPTEMLELAMKNLRLKKSQLISEEDKENLSEFSSQSSQDSGYQSCIIQNTQRIKSDSSAEISLKMRSYYGDRFSSPEECDESGRKPLVNMPNKTCPVGRVPIHLVTSPDSPSKQEAPPVVKKDRFSSPEECDENGRKPLVNMPNKTCPFGRVPIHLVTSPDSPSKQEASPVVKKHTFDSMRVPILPSLSKTKYVGEDDALNSLNKLTNNNSPPYVQPPKEYSLEMKTSSSLILNRNDSNLTVKRKEELTDDTISQFISQEDKQAEPYTIPKLNRKQSDPFKPGGVESEWKWKVPETPSDIFQHEGKRMSIEPGLARRVSPLGLALKKHDPVFVCATPVSKPQDDYMNCFRTPVVKNSLPPMPPLSTPCNNPSSYQQPQTPANAFLPPACYPVSTPLASNDYIVVKGRPYTVLKQIGTGGSSKVFQVMDEKKHLYAIKYVNLHEADQQTIESYQNEISHLNRLQQHCDKIIRLYDYEITQQHIYMVMECGNIDLNSWLRKKKTIDPWERKSYWKNMLEAVHTIHQHGIVHSDLKPANFIIVDGMLKLIDFGIANQIQPDVTSIVKDSQVGTINYMPPEAIKDTTSYGENGRPRSKISPKGDVWSLGCILYCMTYGKTPFQHITNQITKLHAILDPGYEIEIPDIQERDLQDVLRKCLLRNPKERISVAELLVHPYVQLPDEKVQKGANEEMKRILGELIGLNSPNSISRAARQLYDQCNSGTGLDISAFGKQANQNTWTMK